LFNILRRRTVFQMADALALLHFPNADIAGDLYPYQAPSSAKSAKAFVHAGGLRAAHLCVH
jgi:hypothetical protein